MSPKEYTEQSGATDKESYADVQSKMTEDNVRIMHYVLGIGTEAGEIQDILKKHVMYGKPMNREHILEESGDLLWYMARLLNLFVSSFEDVMEMNNKKLKARYGGKFSEQAAIERRDIKTITEKIIQENYELFTKLVD